MAKVKKALILGLAAMMALNIFSSYLFASEAKAAAIEKAVESRMLIDTIQISASECKEIYDEMGEYSSWSSTIASSIVGMMGAAGMVVGGVTTIAAAIQAVNYNQAKSAFLQGWQSGNGCRMLIYDNAAPTILAN